MAISTRIRTIGNFISNGDVVADIGADHGLLETYLVAKYDNVLVTAVENKLGPYHILKKNISGYKNVNLSYSDGLSRIDESHNVVVLAGMGGLNIKKIFEQHPEKMQYFSKIIIDAHRDIPVIRKYLVEKGYKIQKEIIVYEDKKFYVVSQFIKNSKPIDYSSETIEFGLKLYNDKLWNKYKDYLIKTNEKVISKITNIEKNQNKILKLKEMNERLLNYGKE